MTDEIHGDFDPAEHAAEAQERWGDTEAYAEASRRTSQYPADTWQTIHAEAADIAQGFARLAAEETPPTAAAAAALTERHRLHIDRWYYPCSHEMHTGLAAMYVADPRFAAWWDAFHPGLASYVRDAIAANQAG